MLIRSLALLALLLAGPGLAAVPEPEDEPRDEPRQEKPAAAAEDTTRFLPRWLRWRASAGLGWISSPTFIRQRYQAGQSFELGLEVRPHAALRMGVSGEYQVLPAVGRAHYQIITENFEGSPIAVDTLSFEWTDRGWLGAARAEVHARMLPHTWLSAGIGRGYLEAGVRPYHFEQPNVILDVEFPGSTAWGWLASLGMRHEFDLLGPVLAAEVRWSALERPLDRLQIWTIRIGWGG